MRRLHKLYTIDVTSVDEEKRQATFCFSDGEKDRQGERVDQASWQVENYKANPLILWGHDPSKPDNVLGQGVELDIDNNGKSYVTAQFDDYETNPNADRVFRQIVKRTLRTVSAGFITHTEEYEDDVPVLKDNELLEISIVPIPANPRAVMLALKSGEIDPKTAEWMAESMRAEADLVEAQIKSQSTTKEKSTMTPEQAQALVDGLTNLNTTITALTEKVEAQATEIAALKPVAPPEETEEQKTAREAQEAADAAAEAQRLADEAAKNPAKPGSDDQGGAGGDEFDEDAELTPEQLAEFEGIFAPEAAA